jgi:hypothetical protein
MTFAYRFCLTSIAIAVIVSSPAHATEPKIDAETCNQLRLEHMKYVESGAAADVQRGAEWGKVNLSPEKLRDLELFIQLDEQIKFGCRDAKLTVDAERASEAAKRLEINSDLDPTAPLPVEGQGSAESDGTADAPASLAATPDAKPKAKPKAVHRVKPAAAKAKDSSATPAAAEAKSAPPSGAPAATP